MRTAAWSPFIVGLQLYGALADVRRDLYHRNVQIAELDGTENIDRAKQEIIFRDPKSDFEDVFRCASNSGKKLTWSACGRFVACCLPGQRLLGSEATAFDCCGAGHDLAGSPAAGYTCCPTGQIYDGHVCKWPEPEKPVCKNGKILVNGHCVCPVDTIETVDGYCTLPPPPPPPPPKEEPKLECHSGLFEGLCYTFTYPNGLNLGFDNKGYYSAAEDSRNHNMGKFKLCKSEKCDSGAAVNPNDAVRIRDLHGQANSGKQANQWLNAAANGEHLGKTDQYAKAGVFSITKWTKGQYCLGGVEHGLSHTCPSDEPSATFTTSDGQSCIPVEVTQVPCDIHALANNCIWADGSYRCPASSAFDGVSCVPVAEAGAVACPEGSSWRGGRCVEHGTGFHVAACPAGSIWDGAACVGAIVCPRGTVWSGHSCEPDRRGDGYYRRYDDDDAGYYEHGTGDYWRAGPEKPLAAPQPASPGKPAPRRAFKPIRDRADRAHPELGDTSFDDALFPCSRGKAAPCRGAQVQGWTVAKMPWEGAAFQQPGAPRPYRARVDFSHAVVMTVVDYQSQAEHFLVRLDGEFLGETGGEDGYANRGYGDKSLDPEWCLANGYSRGYFVIPAGPHEIQVEWPVGTGRYKDRDGKPYAYGAAQYRFDRLCDHYTCS